jgi:hypothetical protein
MSLTVRADSAAVNRTQRLRASPVPNRSGGITRKSMVPPLDFSEDGTTLGDISTRFGE